MSEKKTEFPSYRITDFPRSSVIAPADVMRVLRTSQSVREAAERLHKSAKWLYHFMSKHCIRATEVGTRMRTATSESIRQQIRNNSRAD